MRCTFCARNAQHCLRGASFERSPGGVRGAVYHLHGLDAVLDRSLFAFVECAGGYVTEVSGSEVNLYFPKVQR
jgi:hypothetical protein